jgi:class 3 adenylate cyclase
LARDHRRLAAIVSLDVAGYSRLMGVDDSGTLAALKAHRRELVDPKIAKHDGRIVKTTGDGLLLEFPSVVEAVRCAVDMQRGMAERNAGIAPNQRLDFRIGINVGDIIIDGDDIFGDGVNVAARLEALADPGGICVSGRVQEDAHGKLDVTFEDAGEQELKNISRLVRVYRILLGERPGSPELATSNRAIPALAPHRVTIREKSAAEIIANLKGSTPSHLFFEKAKELYVGRRTQEPGWQVIVHDLPSKRSRDWLCMFREVGSGPIVAASTVQDLSALRVGDSATVSGRISDVSLLESVILEDAIVRSDYVPLP